MKYRKRVDGKRPPMVRELRELAVEAHAVDTAGAGSTAGAASCVTFSHALCVNTRSGPPAVCEPRRRGPAVCARACVCVVTTRGHFAWLTL
ncbi:hypothetical protein EVAR_86010_1 [Eumeta japonica]|uniref:Uncharacterized protein n=1 Tax=Eumeta variegata TaxID=151549 RepID=A0A4C1UJA9_EUMVA|nr:hypothetical protein EVAR_86010_1 [Eumeta japonica]